MTRRFRDACVSGRSGAYPPPPLLTLTHATGMTNVSSAVPWAAAICATSLRHNSRQPLLGEASSRFNFTGRHFVCLPVAELRFAKNFGIKNPNNNKTT